MSVYLNTDTHAFLEACPKDQVCILLHGLFGMSSNILSVAKGISSLCYPIVYDLPNHGLSPTQEQCDFISMAKMLNNSIEHHKLVSKHDKVHLIGHSLGGKLAMVYSLIYPHKTASLIVMDIAPVTYPPYHKDIIIALKQVLIQQPTTRQQVRNILMEYCSSEEAMFLSKSFDFNERGVFSKIRINEIEAQYDVLRSFPHEELEGKIYTEDMLLIRSKKSEYFVEEYYSEIERYFPGWELEEVPDTGHNIHIDNPVFTMNVIRHFYQQVI